MPATDLHQLCVSVVAGSRRVDLLVPAALPVAELLPEVVGALGVRDDRQGEPVQLRLVGGRVLDSATGLEAQGVADGAVLVLDRTGEQAVLVHDDLAGLVADVVDHDVPHWEPTAGRLVGCATGVTLLALGPPGLHALGGTVAAVAAAVASLLLVVAGVLIARRPVASPLGMALCWLAVAYAAAAGWLAAGVGHGLTGAAVGALVAGVSGAAGLGRRRAALLPAPLAGGVFLGAALVATAGSVPVVAVLTTVLVVVVVAGDAFPALAAASAGLHPEPLLEEVVPAGLDPRTVAGDVVTAHERLVGLEGAAGLVLAGVTPVAVAQGAWGTVLALGCAVAVLLRAGRRRVRGPALVGRLSGVAALVSVPVSSCWLHPGWRPFVVVGTVVAGALVLVVASSTFPGSLRSRRWAELAETVTLVALPPLLLPASGMLAVVRDWVP